MKELIHFCNDSPKVAVCDLKLESEDFKKYYDSTSNSFADVTCLICRNWIREYKLKPGNFSDPDSWNSK